MADIRKSVDIIFGAEDNTKDGLGSVIKGMDDLNSGIKNATQPLADLFDKIFKIQAGLVGLGSAAGLWAVKTAADVSDAFREISTLVDKPLSDLGDFQKEIINAAATSSSTFASFQGAIYSAISAGIDYTDSVKFTLDAEKLAIAGKADLNQSLIVLVSALNAYGKGSDEAAYFSDLLFTTVKQGQTTLPELASSLAQVTAIAANAGVDFDQLLAAVASLTSVGFGTAEAITGLKATITAILKPTSDQTDAAKKLGIEFNLAALQTKGLAGFMQSVGEATGGSEEALISLFPNVRAMGPALALTGLAADTFANNLDAMKNSAGSVDIAYGKMVDSFALGNQRVINSFKAMLIQVGDPLLDEMTQIQNALASIFATIRDSFAEGALRGVGKALEDVAKSIAIFLTQFATNLPAALGMVDFTSAVDAMKMFTDAVKGLFVGIDLSTPEGLARVIDTAVLAFVKFQEVATSQVERIVPLINKLKLLAGIFLESDSGFTRGLGSLLAFGKEVNVITGMLSPLFDIMGALVGVLNTLVLVGFAKSLGVWGMAIAGVTTTAGLLLPILGFAGLATAVGVLGIELGKVIENTTGFGSAIGRVAGYALSLGGDDTLGTWLYGVFNRSKEAELALALVGRSTADLELTQRRTRNATQEFAAGLVELNKEAEIYGVSWRYANDLSKITIKEFEALKFASNALGKEVTDVNQAMALYEEHLAKVAEEAKKAAAVEDAAFVAKNRMADLMAQQNIILDAQGAAWRRTAEGTLVSVEAWNRLGNSVGEVIRAGKDGFLSAEDAAKAYALYGDNWTLLNGIVQRTMEGVTISTDNVIDKTGQWMAILNEDGTTTYQQIGRVAPKEIKKVEEAFTEAEKAAMQFELTMMELASNERIAFIEAKVSLDIAELQTNAEIVVALIEGVASIIDSTIGGINTLFSMTENPEWDRFGFAARDQLKTYNEILQEQLAIQKDIAVAQIAYMNAKTQSLSRGDAMVQIDGAGLQPHLEGFMFEILRAIQVRVNEQGLEMLLGAPA